MKKIIYIIPGNGENCNLVRYKALAKALTAQDYTVKPVNPDWYQPMSGQIFRVEKDAIICGFSFGAVLAYLIAKKFPCRKVIFASISPIHTFSFKILMDDLMLHMSKDQAFKITADVKKIRISLKSLKMPYITLAGEKEKIKANFLVPNTGHYMSVAYIKCIAKFAES